MHTPTTFRHTCRRRAISICVNESYHGSSKSWIIWHNSFNRRSGLQQGSKIYPLPENDYWRRGSKVVSETPTTLVWNTQKDHIWQRSLFHFAHAICKDLGINQNLSMAFHPQDWWTDRMHECIDWAVPLSMDHGMTKWFGNLSANGRVHA